MVWGEVIDSCAPEDFGSWTQDFQLNSCQTRALRL